MGEVGAAQVISIVEDDPAVRQALGNLLESVGLRVEAFASAEEFLEFGRASNIACLILDIRLPGMSGLELQSRLLEQQASTPIIFLTSDWDDKIREQALRDG